MMIMTKIKMHWRCLTLKRGEKNALSGHYSKTCLSASCCSQSISQSGRETHCWFSKNKFQVGSTIAANTPSKGSLLVVAKHRGIKNGDVGASGGGRGGGVVSTDLGRLGVLQFWRTASALTISLLNAALLTLGTQRTALCSLSLHRAPGRKDRSYWARKPGPSPRSVTAQYLWQVSMNIYWMSNLHIHNEF